MAHNLAATLKPQPGKVICIITGKPRHPWSKSVVIGVNDRGAYSERYRKTMPDGAVLSTRHAEEHALSLAHKWGIEVRSVTVLRYGKTGKLRMAKPCRSCQAKIEKVNPKVVYYSNEEGEIVAYG